MGLDVVYAASWPKAIHEGNGTMQLFISKSASDKQRDALVKIFSDEAKERDTSLSSGQPTSIYLNRNL